MPDAVAISDGAKALPPSAWERPSLRLTGLFGTLVCLGTVMVASTAAGADPTDAQFAGAVVRQLLLTAFGVIAFVAAACVDYRFWHRHRTLLATLALGSLVAVLVPGVGTEINWARRWLRFSSTFVCQPSEFAKVALIIWMAAYCARAARTPDLRTGQPLIRSFAWGFLVPGAVAVVAGGLVLLEPDFGTCLLIVVLCMAVMLVCGTRPLFPLLAALAAVPLVLKLVVDTPYRLDRVMIFLDPWRDPDQKGYQLIQSLIAVGSGGLTGKGLGLGAQKMGFVPAAPSDFIFSIVGEELGFLGALCVLAIYGWILWEGLKVALRAGNTYAFALAFGITALIGLQAAVNLAVVTGLVPTKGLSLPLVSAGGSSLCATLWAAGILVNIARSEEGPPGSETCPAYEGVPCYERWFRGAGRTVLALVRPGAGLRGRWEA